MNDCEFKKECGELKHEYGDCVLIEPPPLNSKTDCEHYQFAVLVHNRAIEKGLEFLTGSGTGHQPEELKALKIKEHSP